MERYWLNGTKVGEVIKNRVAGQLRHITHEIVSKNIQK
jgi:hypothetical protein